ncbi:hypothetical protein OUZ56_006656 [Daphnia magna]|uniref:Uncharacterized protein n=1 Tax=Daphnia magna TaxID=35525 RepID=A0ABQ9YW97_9CRUS|nr:hypothetical protein OUZ56_006656 [Daphnia magna]
MFAKLVYSARQGLHFRKVRECTCTTVGRDIVCATLAPCRRSLSLFGAHSEATKIRRLLEWIAFPYANINQSRPIAITWPFPVMDLLDYVPVSLSKSCQNETTIEK